MSMKWNDYKICVDKKIITISDTGRIAVFREGIGGFKSLFVDELNANDDFDERLLSNLPLENVLFCWDSDCDVVEPDKVFIESYIRDFLRESSVDALEEVKVFFLFPFFENSQGRKYYIARIAKIQVEEFDF